MHINPEEISSIIRKQIENFDVELKMDEVGTVLEVGDGIARVYGLEKAMANEMVQFENGAYGLDEHYRYQMSRDDIRARVAWARASGTTFSAWS